MHRVFIGVGAMLIAATSYAAIPRFPNSTKYRDTSLPKATGRSGNATIEAQALLGKDGVTTLEVVTNGSFDKVQVKIPTDGDALTYNYNDVSGAAFTTTLQNLGRSSPLDVNGTVSGVDANRTDVVSARETVKLRPDLAVDAVRATPHAEIGVPVPVAAIVSEKNGDVGARADCVLYDGDTELLRSRGIWVDAGGTVTCAFSPIFQEPGVKNLRVALEGVAPGDFDTANNAAVTETQLYDHATPFPDNWMSWCIEFRDKTTYTYSSPERAEYRTSDSYRQMTTLDAVFTGPMNLQTLKATAQVSSDGQPIYIGDDIESEYENVEELGFQVLLLHGDGFDGQFFAYGSGANQSTRVNIRHNAGQVTYHTEGFEYSYWDGYYTWNVDDGYDLGPITPFGNFVSMTATLSDGTTMWREDESNMPINPYESVYSWSFCYSRPRQTTQTCESIDVEQYGRWGYDYIGRD